MFQWVQLYALSREDVTAIIKTFSEVFPSFYLFDDVQGTNIYLIGTASQEPLLDMKIIQEKFEDPKIRDEWSRIYVNGPEEFISYFVAGPDLVKEAVHTSRIHTDDRPFLEFSSPKTIYSSSINDNLELILNLRKNEDITTSIFHAPNTKTFQNLFLFRQKLLEVLMAFNDGNLDQSFEHYRKARNLGIDNAWIQEKMKRIVFDYQDYLRKQGREEEAKIFVEETKWIFQTITNKP